MQRRPTAPPVPQPQPQPPATSLPGRGYGELPQADIEKGMSADEKRANRAAALLELARQPLNPKATVSPLPDDWQRTQSPDLVDDLARAAQRHDVPLEYLARAMYQEGKFNQDPSRPLVWSSPHGNTPIGWAQITQDKLNTMRRLAVDRGDVVRALELKHYSLVNREQAFDLAAEILAYQRRLLGSWHASVAAYNKGENFVSDWLAGRDRSEPFQVNGKLETFNRDPYSWGKVNTKTQRYENDRWNEMKNYLATVFRGTPDESPAYKIYDYRDPERLFRVPPYIPRSPNVASHDTLDNP